MNDIVHLKPHCIQIKRWWILVIFGVDFFLIFICCITFMAVFIRSAFIGSFCIFINWFVNIMQTIVYVFPIENYFFFFFAVRQKQKIFIQIALHSLFILYSNNDYSKNQKESWNWSANNPNKLLFCYFWFSDDNFLRQVDWNIWRGKVIDYIRQVVVNKSIGMN